MWTFGHDVSHPAWITSYGVKSVPRICQFANVCYLTNIISTIWYLHWNINLDHFTDSRQPGGDDLTSKHVHTYKLLTLKKCCLTLIFSSNL